MILMGHGFARHCFQRHGFVVSGSVRFCEGLMFMFMLEVVHSEARSGLLRQSLVKFCKVWEVFYMRAVAKRIMFFVGYCLVLCGEAMFGEVRSGKKFTLCLFGLVVFCKSLFCWVVSGNVL